MTTLTQDSPPVASPVDEKGGNLTTLWLRWFRLLWSNLSTLLGSYGGKVLQFPYAQFFDTSTQTAAAATVATITFNSTLYATGLQLGSPTSRMVNLIPGYYNVQFTVLAENTSAAFDDVTIWYRKNGTDVANTATICGVPPKHGAINGHLVISSNFLVLMAVGDYLELCWTTDSGASSLIAFPIGVGPVHPLSPSATATFEYVSRS